MKHEKIFLILIIILGFILRLINIDKPEGLWNDEYVSWFVSSVPFNKGFWEEILKQCHMPFYYLYLKPFCNYNDIVLRLTSVVPSLLAIPVMYLAGNEISKRIGFISASITAALPFLVYYAQEVRFYSLVFLFTALILLFTLKLLKTTNKVNLTGYILSAFLLVTTHVLSFIYLFFNTAYLIYKKKKFSLKILIPLSVIIILLIFFGINILKMLPSSQWWGRFSYSNILFLFSDFFSPVLTNNINAPAVFFYNKSILFIILITIPTLIGFTGVITGSKSLKGISITVLLTLLTMCVLASGGTIVFITKYSIEILPALILLIAAGYEKLLAPVIILLIFYILGIFTPYYPAKLPRVEGHKIPGEILNSVRPDIILYTYYEPDRFYRYMSTDAATLYISKINRFEYLDNPAKILNTVKSGEKISVVFLDSVSFIPPNYINEAENRNIPEMFITFSKIRNSLIKTLNDNYGDFDLQHKGSWTVITATKVK